MNCKYCRKECKNANSLSQHERLCKENPDRQESNFKYIKQPWNKGLTKADPRVAKHGRQVSKALTGRKSNMDWTPERRKAKSDWRKQYHIDHPEAHPNRRLSNNRAKMSYPEKVAYDWLVKNDIRFDHNPKVGSYYPDFVIGSTIIEIDGEYWHDEEKDKRKDDFFNSLGYTVHRINAVEKIEEALRILGVG